MIGGRLHAQRLNSLTTTIFTYPGNQDILFFSTIYVSNFSGLALGEPSRTDFVALAVLDPGQTTPSKKDYIFLGFQLNPAAQTNFNIFVQGGSTLIGHDGVPSGVVASQINMMVFGREIVDLGQRRDRG